MIVIWYTGATQTGTPTAQTGANTVHDIEISTVGIDGNTRSYEITW